MRHETRMGCAALAVMHPRLRQAERAVDGQVDVAGVFVFLTVILPPAHGAQQERARRIERPESAARTAVIGFHPRGWTAAPASGLHAGPGIDLGTGIVTTAELRRLRRLRVSESENQAGVEAGVVSSAGRLGGCVDAVGGKSPGEEGKEGKIDAAAQIVGERSTGDWEDCWNCWPSAPHPTTRVRTD